MCGVQGGAGPAVRRQVGQAQAPGEARQRRAPSTECQAQPDKTTEILLVSDAAHLAAYGGDGDAAAVDAIALMHATEMLFNDDRFDCDISFSVVGHVVFEGSSDARLPARACNTVDDRFLNALPTSDDCCAWLFQTGSVATPAGCDDRVYCLDSDGGFDSSEPGCYSKSVAFGQLTDAGGQPVLEAELFSVTDRASTDSGEVDGYQLLDGVSRMTSAVGAGGYLRQLFADNSLSVDHVMLLSGSDLNGQLRGVAYVSGMCSAAQSVSIVMADLGALSGATVVTAAHELGHSFGMVRRHMCAAALLLLRDATPGRELGSASLLA